MLRCYDTLALAPGDRILPSFLCSVRADDGLTDHLDPPRLSAVLSVPMIALLESRVDDLLGAARDGERVRSPGLTREPGEILKRDDIPGSFRSPSGTETGADLGDGAGEKWVNHGKIPDHDGHKGLANGPAAGLLSTIGTGLFMVATKPSVTSSTDMGVLTRVPLTVRIRAQRRMPAIITNTPPPNMTSSQAFFLGSIWARQNN